MIQKALNESRIRVVAVKNKKLVTKLEGDFGLGRGEAEAIALALAEKAQVLGIDDKNGINASKLLGIPFTTAIGILVRNA
jgi:predicted nucleic acid-binding protein